MGQHLIFGLPATALLFLILALALRRTRHLHAEAGRRMEAEEALKHGQRLEALGQLTGGVAHDFNNLLTVIRASADMLRRPQLTEERRLRYVEAISDTVDRAAKLTAQLLAFARRQTLKPELFDVGENVQTLSEIIRTLTGARVEIVTRVPGGPCLINADASQFETALINMAVNARDAMGGEGRLTIAVRSVAELPGPAPQPQSPHGYVAVSVEDTGVGIPQGELGRIFEPFFTTKEVGQGTGLGLSQVFGFAKQSGGEVTVTSEVGKGSTFTLYLPRVVDDGQPLAAPAEMPVPVDGRGISVLVVEDNPEVGKFAADALAELGYAVTLVGNATHALEELIERRGPLRRGVHRRGDARHDRHRARQGNPPPPFRPAGGADQRLQPRAGAERQLWFRAVAEALFDRAAVAHPAQGRPLANRQARRRGVRRKRRASS